CKPNKHRLCGKERVIWRHLNNVSTIGSTSDYEIIGCVPGVEVDIDGVKVVQKFHVKCGFCCDVILGMPWVMKTRCSFEWKDEKCHCSIMKNDDQKENEFVDVRCIKGKLTENDGASEEKEKCSDGKDNNVDVVNVRCVVNILEDNKAEFDYNGDEQKAFVQCQSLGKMSCGNETRDHNMLKAKRNVNNFVRLNGVSCRRVKTSRKVVNNVYASLVESALRNDNAKVKVMNTLRFESNESFDKG
ncbi:6681_t:CDS:2, partial [Dentiscutata heterogama]